ncbi:unnamed protein product, partial [Schistosoma turkestanicum]
ILRSQDSLSLNKYSLSTHRPEDTFIKYISIDNNSSLHNHHHHHQSASQKYQRESLLFHKTDFNQSKSQLSSTNTTNDHHHHQPNLHEFDPNEFSHEKSKSIIVTTLTNSITSTTTTTTTATTTTSILNTSLDTTLDHLKLYKQQNDQFQTKPIARLVPPLIGLNEINGVNESQTLPYDICISNNHSSSNNNNNNHTDNDDSLSNPSQSQRDPCTTNELSISNNHNHHNHNNNNNTNNSTNHLLQDSFIQSNCWLPKVAMNSNRVKCDEILSTSWNLLTMKNWKSDQELKRKMGLFNHKINGGFWFREKSITHTKPFVTGRRRMEHQSQSQSQQQQQQPQQQHGHHLHQLQSQQQQSKGMTFSAIVNHCPLLNQYLPSNKA